MTQQTDTTTLAHDRRRDFAWIIVAYTVALVAAWATVVVGQSYTNDALYGPLYLGAAADLSATLVIFGFSRWFGNSSFYDAYWSVIPPVLLAYWFWAYGVLDFRLVLVWLLVTAWAVRLTHNWARGWQGLTHVDWRYVDLQQSTGKAYPLVDLLGIQLLPTVLVFAGCVPVWIAITATAAGQTTSIGLLDLPWILVGTAAVYLEFRADNVLRRFRLNPQNRGQVLRHDVWAWCRHPNYLGEIGFWLSLALAGFAVSDSAWVWLGFVLMVILFVGITIPMIDKRQLANKPDYATYREEVFSLIPKPPRTST